jgi:glycerol uptake facilitator-like aquaporin
MLHSTSTRQIGKGTLTRCSLYRALSFGFSLAVNAWIFFRVSGGLFNPAVSLGMVLVGALTPLRGALLAFSQILGGITVSLYPLSLVLGKIVRK